MFGLFISNWVGDVWVKIYDFSYGINFDILCGLLAILE